MAGCASQEEAARRTSSADDAKCNSMGFWAGNPSYAQCRLALEQMRFQQQSNDNAAAAALLGFGATMYQSQQNYYNTLNSRSSPSSFTCYQQGVFTNCNGM
jgi:hypothetical protein